MNCPMCAMRAEIDDLVASQEKERIALGRCWITGGMLNDKPTPTVIKIDCPIALEERRELYALLKKIEHRHEKTQSNNQL